MAECRDYLNEMITWDFEDFAGVGQIHHLTVLSYNLQHPRLYSSCGLENAKASLVDFLKNPTSYTEHGMRDREHLASDVRDWKVTGTTEDHGRYAGEPQWRMRASDVVAGGLANYIENVKKWSRSVLDALIQSGDIGTSNT